MKFFNFKYILPNVAERGIIMKKRLTLIALLLFALILSGCTSLQNQYIQLQKDYDSLSSDFNQLQSDYEDLQQKYEVLQNKPDITVSLLDGLNIVRILNLYSSLEDAQSNYTLYYFFNSVSNTKVPVTITLNCDNSIKNIFYVSEHGTMNSVMEDVSTIGSTYTFSIPADSYNVKSLILELEDGCLWHSSYKGTYHSFELD